MLELIFLFFLSGYFLQSVIFIIGAKKRFKKLNEEDLPTVTVLVAARNEDKNILACLHSLNEINYPKDKIQIIIADDGSTDKTGKIIDEFINNKSQFLKIFVDEQIGNLKGKTNALALALKNATGKIILTTDADCTVKPSWVKSIASYYTDNVGIVNGYTTQIANKHFNGMQALDFIYLQTVAAGTINLNKPVSCIGNNMSFLRKAYDEVGGFENIPFSVTEDFMLLNQINKLGRYKILYPLETEALVTSNPCKNLKEIYHQKKRWAVGGLDVPLLGFLIMFWGYFTNLLLFLTPLFFSPAWLYLAFFKLTIDFFVLYPMHLKLGIKKNMKYFIAHQLYYIIYVLALPFIVLAGKKVTWKGRKYN